MELEKSKQEARDLIIERKKQKQFEKHIKVIIEHLDDSFTFKPLDSFQRMIIHQMAEKYRLFHSTDNEKIIISKTPIQQIDLLSEQLKTASLTDDNTRKYNLRQRNGKK